MVLINDQHYGGGAANCDYANFRIKFCQAQVNALLPGRVELHSALDYYPSVSRQNKVGSSIFDLIFE